MTSPFPAQESPCANLSDWYAPTPGYLYEIPASPSNFSYISSCHSRPSQNSTPPLILDKLPLVGLDDWQAGRAYDELPPICIHYSIEWKVALNKRVVSEDTEQNLVLAPGAYWEKFLKGKLARVVAQKFLPSQRVRLDDTAIIVKINDRTEHDLTKRLISFINGGGILHSERDIPDWFHQQLKAEEQLLNSKTNDKGLSSYRAPCPPINIILPTQSPQTSISTPTAPSSPLTKRFQLKRLDISGPRDIAVKEYSEWHASEVNDEDLKNDFRKACQVALKNGLDLQQIVNRPNPKFFIERDIKIGTAHRFVDDIIEWVEIRRDQMDTFDF
ncbi:hypothetical protein N7495_003922 [Penicillium taxi]|uniref:uncharacterized protein n=1 Tax=Penicillium taxi TaxID=168475 RepID=UPI0025454F41|nr:uncharacterized protein N7495_003922 [Penicillium taxi]KAJ5899178.1 hypothetical protein N7495_003922 [Penicillium taxi]